MHFQVMDTTCFLVVSVTTYLAIKNVTKNETIFLLLLSCFMQLQVSISTAHKSRSLQISERFCLTSSLIPYCDCNSTASVDIYFSPIICLQFKQYLFILLQKCKKVESLN